MTTAADLFAGLGGFSLGAKDAGVEVAWAANHWPLAVDTHKLNHPDTEHACQDLHQADWSKIRRVIDILLAAPCCQGHAKASGLDRAWNRTHHDTSRSTAWAVVAAAEALRPGALLVENVPEFADWALFPSWCAALEALGFSLSRQVVNAADLGVPQERLRLLVVGTRSRAPLHLQLPKLDHQPFEPLIRWDRYRFSPIADKAEATRRRVSNGRAAHGDRFLAPYYSSGSGLTGRSLHRPIGTITTLDRWSLIDGDRMRMLQPDDELKEGMGFPASYKLPPHATRRQKIHMLGNAIAPPMAKHAIEQLLRAA